MAARQSGHTVTEIVLPERAGRHAEFKDLAQRTLLIQLKDFDVFHATTPHSMAIRRRPTVASILDLIPLDLPAYRKTGIKAELFLRLAAKAAAVLTISEFSKKRIADRLSVDAARIFVAPLPPSPVFLETPDTVQDLIPVAATARAGEYVAVLADMATPDPRKRVQWIAPLAADLRREGLRLLVAGAGTETSQELGAAEGLGRLDDRALAALYRGAVCFAYFSAYEGQGLPPMEAMATGTPAVALANSAVTEVVGDAGVLIRSDAALRPGEPLDAQSQEAITQIATECARIAGDRALRRELSGQSRAHVRANFSSERFAEALSDAYSYAWSA
jgi:glycosyltransferase involved in cell wall biosynthesis